MKSDELTLKHPTTKGKIFGIGLSRTGTTKLCSILDSLGYKTRHFVPELLEPANWDAVEEVEALADTPIQVIYKECDLRYPESLFILTTRDLDSWLESMEWLFEHGRIIWNWGPRVYAYIDLLYQTTHFDRNILTECWHSYHSNVFEYFEGRELDLLVIDISDGFDVPSICDFLGIETREIEPNTTINGRRSASMTARARFAAKYALYTRWIDPYPNWR